MKKGSCKCDAYISRFRISISISISICTSEQCDENLAANSVAARKFIEDMELSMTNQEHMQL